MLTGGKEERDPAKRDRSSCVCCGQTGGEWGPAFCLSGPTNGDKRWQIGVKAPCWAVVCPQWSRGAGSREKRHTRMKLSKCNKVQGILKDSTNKTIKTIKKDAIEGGDLIRSLWRPNPVFHTRSPASSSPFAVIPGIYKIETDGKETFLFLCICGGGKRERE